jgi:ketosteroid isomerase-like protein
MDAPDRIALRFTECINHADLAGLAGLMTADHLFTDREGTTVRGRTAMLDNWRRFFARFPGYRNVVARAEATGDLVTLTGHAEWTPGGPPDPAVWEARIASGLVTEWRVRPAPADSRG